MSLMGIDVGTSGCKVIAISQHGEILAQAGESYTLKSPERGMFELDPLQVWEKVANCIRKCNNFLENDPVLGLSISSQGEAVIPLDVDMNPLDLAPVSADLRGLPYVKMVEETFGEEKIFSITGQLLDPIHSLFKILWWNNERKNIHHNIWKYCCFDTYILLCLGMPPVTDRSMAARMMLYDITTGNWSDELISYASLHVSNLPEVIDSGMVLGILSNEVSKALGFSTCPSVVLGGHDQPCAAFGNGMVDEGFSYSIGTTECISIIRKAGSITGSVSKNPTYPHLFPNTMVTLIGSQTGTRLFSWLGNLLFDTESYTFMQNMERFYNLIRSVPNTLETSVIFLPHLFGGSSNYGNPHAKALLFGFSQDTDKHDFIKAAMEGVTIEQYLGYQKFIQLNGPSSQPRSIIVTGGGVRFSNWLSIKADIFQIPFRLMESYEAGCRGAAMLAGIGIGAYASPHIASIECVRESKTIHPDPSKQPYYENKIKQFDELYHLINEFKK
jgi:xylulokinase